MELTDPTERVGRFNAGNGDKDGEMGYWVSECVRADHEPPVEGPSDVRAPVLAAAVEQQVAEQHHVPSPVNACVHSKKEKK